MSPSRTPEPPPVPPRPPLLLLGTEPVRAALEFAATHVLPRGPAPRGDGHPVIIFPGLASDGNAVAPLRAHCRRLGYAATDWGRGFNTGPRGDLDAWMGDLAREVAATLARHRRPATLVGWSLGGLYARELAKLLPAGRVRQVITIGTPFNASEDRTHVGWLYRLLNGAPLVLEEGLHRRLRTPPPVPTTSLYSRGDGVVAWQTCLHDRPGPRVQDIEVPGSHVGMGWNRHVLQVVADRLAQPLDDWRPYTGPYAAGAGDGADGGAVRRRSSGSSPAVWPRTAPRRRARGTPAAAPRCANP